MDYNTPKLSPFPAPQGLPGHPRYNGVDFGSLWGPSAVYTGAREQQASESDVLLALNRMLGLAPARTDRVGSTAISPVIPSPQAAKEADFIYRQSGAQPTDPQEYQMSLIQEIMQTLGMSYAGAPTQPITNSR